MAVANLLKNREQMNKVLTVAFGLQAITGHPCYAKYESSIMHAYNALGEGQFDGIVGAFYKGIWIPPADYNFHAGALATGMTSGPQVVDSFFSNDVPHSRTAAIGYKCPSGVAGTDPENYENRFEGIFRTKKVPHYDSSGSLLDFSYSVNPARCIIELLMTYCRLPNLPASYATIADYWISRIDWGNWFDFHEFMDGKETADYTLLDGGEFDGFGLTATYFNALEFVDEVKTFVQPVIDKPSDTNPPASGVESTTFSAIFNGKIKAKYSQTYTFHLTHDDGVRLWVDGALLIDEWADGAATDTGTIALTAGQFYDIELHWYNNAGASQIKLEWSSASQTQEVIPSQHLYPWPSIRNRTSATSPLRRRRIRLTRFARFSTCAIPSWWTWTAS